MHGWASILILKYERGAAAAEPVSSIAGRKNTGTLGKIGGVTFRSHVSRLAKAVRPGAASKRKQTVRLMFTY